MQKSLVEYRLGTIVAVLGENYKTLIQDLAKKLFQGREGYAIAWPNNKLDTNTATSENLFITGDIDRQDLIGKICIYEFM